MGICWPGYRALGAENQAFIIKTGVDQPPSIRVTMRAA
jgi:hypothetical protein